jgi:cytidylate kinase
MENKKLIITIDGPSAAGKSTLAKLLAQRLNYHYLDTGSMYRAIAWKVINSKVYPEDKEKVIKLAEKCSLSLQYKGDAFSIYINNKDITDKIRDEKIGEVASIISSIPEVRKRMVEIQRTIVKAGGFVLEGRDTGTIVCPQAEVKFYLDASPQERGKRRYLDLQYISGEVDIKKITEEILQRDDRDSKREHSPLKKAKDAIYIDSTILKIEEVLEIMLQKVREYLSREQ